MPDLTTRTRRERFDLKALYETSRLLSSSLDQDFVLDSLLFTAMSKLLVSRGMILLFDPLEDGYRVASAKGASGVTRNQILRFLCPSSVEGSIEVNVAMDEYGITLCMTIDIGSRYNG